MSLSLFKSASIISVCTLGSRVTGLGRDLLIASLFGANAMTDAFNVAFRIPNMFRRLFGEGAFAQAFVPELATTRARDGDSAARVLVEHVYTILFVVLAITCVVGVLGAPLLVMSLGGGLSQTEHGYDAAVQMTQIMFPYIGFISLVAMAAGVLNTWGHFALPASAPMLLNVSIIGVAWYAAPWFQSRGWPTIYTLAYGVMLGGVLQLIFMLAALHKTGIRPCPRLGFQVLRTAWRDAGCQRIVSRMVPALFAVGVAQLSLLINTQIASYLTPGSVSWLSYADRLLEFPIALLGVAMGIALLPNLSQAWVSGDHQRYCEMLDWGLRAVLLLTVPCVLALLILATPLVAVLFHYGAFTGHDVLQTRLALMGYGVGLLGMVSIKVLAPGFFAKGDVKTPAQIAVLVLLVTQLLNWVLVPWLAHAGLALSIGLGAWVNAGILWWGLRRRGVFRLGRGWWRFLFQVGLASGLLAVCMWWGAAHFDWLAMQQQPWHRMQYLFGTLAVSVCLYFGTLHLLGFNWRFLLRV